MTPQQSKPPTLYQKILGVYLELSDSKYDISFLVLLLVFEYVLCTAIIQFVPYTEIDWIAYMEEVETYMEGERDYINIRGGTGPLVYPAGFLYLFRFIRYLTNNGTNIRAAQNIFAFFYLLNTMVVLIIYKVLARRYADDDQQQAVDTHKQHQDESISEAKQKQIKKAANTIWSWRIAMILTCLSKRIHSIFVLRLFNDGPTMILLYLSVLFFMRNNWRIGCIFFSLSVSIKMNILLFAPGLLLLLLQSSSTIIETIICLFICGIIQIMLGAPFLVTYPISYLRKAFELDRVFFFKWTVNWKFLPEDIFLSKQLALVLLSLHLGCLGIFCYKWLLSCKKDHKQNLMPSLSLSSKLPNKQTTSTKKQLTPEYVVCTLFLSNFVGIVFARTLHYQFYSWYFHTIPLLLWCSNQYPIVVRILLWFAIEYAFNIFPATPSSSAVLQIAHALTLLSAVLMKVPRTLLLSTNSAIKQN